MSDHDPRSEALVGTVLDGAYRLDRLITEGGMGTVYEATQLRLERRVAVKVMAAELAANPEALARFRREVQVTSQLAHPHVIQLLDYGALASGQPYLVMEYLEGEDLEQRLRRVGRLTLPNALEVVRQVAAALAVTHARGIVHRDLKPANVFLLAVEGVTDFVKLVDFGVSKVRTAKTKLTRAQVMVGTPSYASPEQATGRIDDVDHRSDQWALACIVWEMLSGRVPFSGSELNEVLAKIVHEEPGPLQAEVPAAVEAVLRRALAKAQADRFPTVSAFARALETAAAPRPAVPVARARGGRPVLWALAVGLALGAGAFLAHRRGLVPWQPATVAPQSEQAPPVPRGERRPAGGARPRRAAPAP